MLKYLFSVKHKEWHIIITIMGIKISIKSHCYEEEENNNFCDDNHITEKVLKKIICKTKANKKCRVLFYVFEISKWKTNSLYELMEKSDFFEPFVVIGFTPYRYSLYTTGEIKEKLENTKHKFEEKGIKTYIGYNMKFNKNISLKKFKPDIVFYQQHLGNCSLNSIKNVKKYALTCYVPYNVPNYCNKKYDYDSFCTQLFRFYTLNKDLKDFYKLPSPDSKSNINIDNIYSVGHTALDHYFLNKNEKEKKYVIYAPHFSIMHPLIHNKFYYSTFNYNGLQILEYAKKHNEFSWVFKPHPNLKESLKKMNLTEENIEAYWEEWNKIGIIHNSFDYDEIFENSKAMITDCGSFCTEYFCSGNPLIHLIHPVSINLASKVMKPMFETFYQVHNNEELINTLNEILINNNDYKSAERKKVLEKMNLINNYAARNIIDDLTSVLDNCG